MLTGTCSEKGVYVIVKVTNEYPNPDEPNTLITNSKQWAVMTNPFTGAWSTTDPAPAISLQEGLWEVKAWLASDDTVNDKNDGVVSGPP